MKGMKEMLLLCLISNATVVSVVDGFVGDWYKYFFDSDGLVEFNSTRLEVDFKNALYGQHIASKVVLRAVSGFMKDTQPSKPLVLSFHGGTGTGKNHVSKIIARNIYEKGENSTHVHLFISTFHFPHKNEIETYRAQLKQWVSGNVSSFPRSMFIFDEMDKMPPVILEIIKACLDNYQKIDGVSYRSAIFLFLSNAGSNIINEITLDFWKKGKDREDIQMYSSDLETKIFKGVFNDKNSGFWHSSLIASYVINYFIPFLPLEFQHVRMCVLAEMSSLHITPDYKLVYEVANGMLYFPKEERMFSINGCKLVREKLRYAYTDQQAHDEPCDTNTHIKPYSKKKSVPNQ